MKTLDFMKFRSFAGFASVILIVVSVIAIALKGINFGLDFTGGTLLEVKYPNAAQLDEITMTLNEAGYRDVVVQHFGAETDVIIRMSEAFRDNLGNEVLQLLKQTSPSQFIVLERSEFVGASVGEELRDQGGYALLLALAAIMLYVAFQFQFKFSVGAVAALFHDVIIVIGLFALFQWEFDLTVLAALLAVIGYSLNDTIVVADRIRENFRMIRRSAPISIINESLSQTLGRTIMTSLTTALVLLALMLVGGEMIYNFALALMIGVIIGTYSSIYVSANMLLLMKISREDLMPPELEEVEDTP